MQRYLTTSLFTFGFLFCLIRATMAACPAPNRADAQPQPSFPDYLQKRLNLSGSMKLPLDVGSGRNGFSPPDYKPSINYNSSLQLFDLPTTRPPSSPDDASDGSTVPCIETSFQYSHQYGSDTPGQILGSFRNLLNGQNITSVTDQTDLGFTAYGSSGQTTLTGKVGISYYHAPCCTVSDKYAISAASNYSSTFFQGDVFIGRTNGGLHHAPFDIAAEYDSGTQATPPKMPMASQGSTVYLSVQPNLSFSFFGESSGNTGSVSYTHSQSLYGSARQWYYSNSYLISLSHSFKSLGETPGSQQAIASAGLSLSNFTQNNASDSFEPPFSTKATTISLSLSSHILPFPIFWYPAFERYANSDKVPRARYATNVKRIAVLVSHDYAAGTITPFVSVTLPSGRVLRLVLDTGSSGIRIFNSALRPVDKADFIVQKRAEVDTFGTSGKSLTYVEELTRVKDDRHIILGSHSEDPLKTQDLGAPTLEVVRYVCPGSADRFKSDLRSDPMIEELSTRTQAIRALDNDLQSVYLEKLCPVESEANAEGGDGIFGVAPAGDSYTSLLSDNIAKIDDTPSTVPREKNALPTVPLPFAFVVSLADGGDKAAVIIPPDSRKFSQLAGSPASDDGYGGFTVINLPSAHGSFSTRFTWCYRTDLTADSSLGSCSSDTYLDTGGGPAHLLLGADQTAFSPIRRDQMTTINNGVNVIASLLSETASPSSIKWSVTTGNCLANTLRVYAQSGRSSNPPPFSTSSEAPATVAPPIGIRGSNGITPFFGYDVLYDYEEGVFGMRQVPIDRLHFC